MAELLRTPAQWASLLSLRIESWEGWQADLTSEEEGGFTSPRPRDAKIRLREFLRRVELTRYTTLEAGASAVFDAKSACAKCGCKSVRTVYIRDWTYGCGSVTGDTRSPSTGEHFHRVCTRCRYAWREEVLV